MKMLIAVNSYVKALFEVNEAILEIVAEPKKEKLSEDVLKQMEENYLGEEGKQEEWSKNPNVCDEDCLNCSMKELCDAEDIDLTQEMMEYKNSIRSE